jgi:hypothetical protein
MTDSPEHAGVVQFIVVPRGTANAAGALQRLLQLAASPNTNITIVRVVGPADNPRRAVIRGPPERIAELRAALGGDLLFEEDASLSFP